MTPTKIVQIAGQCSSGNIPGWRRVNIDEITSAMIRSQTFAGHRPYQSHEHSNFDMILGIVTYRDEIAE